MREVLEELSVLIFGVDALDFIIKWRWRNRNGKLGNIKQCFT
jgi:hypothetical protein